MTVTPNMNLVLPVPSTTAGPLYAQQEVTAFNLVDAHDHSSGRGVAIPTAGLNINADLSIGGYNLNSVNGLRLVNLTVTPTAALDVRIVYSKNGELAYRDASGNEVLITASGSVAGATGTITGLSSPATAAFSSITSTFTFSKDSSKPGKLAISDINLYEFDNASANAITIESPASLASAYTLTLPPSVPASGVDLVNVDSAGVMNHAVLAGTAGQLTVTQSATAITLSLPATVSTTTVRLGAGVVGAPSFSFNSDTSSGMYLVASNQLGFAASGVLGLTLSSGTATFGGQIRAPSLSANANGALGTPIYGFQSDGGTGMYLVSNGHLGLAAAGALALTLSSGVSTFGQSVIINGSLEVGVGAFNVRIFTGTLLASNTVLLTAPSGVVLGATGWGSVSGSAVNYTPIAPFGTGTDIAFGNLSTSTQVHLRNNNGSSSNTYRVVMVYG